jgi:hypothetical protein
MVLKASPMIHILMIASQREVSNTLPRVSSRAHHRRRFFVMCPVQKRDIAKNFLKVLRHKAQVPKISDDQVIAQAIKAFCAGPLHIHLVRERPKRVQELYENLKKFNKSEVLHF